MVYDTFHITMWKFYFVLCVLSFSQKCCVTTGGLYSPYARTLSLNYIPSPENNLLTLPSSNSPCREIDIIFYECRTNPT